MPGAYAHITLVNLCREEGRMVGHGMPQEGGSCLRDHFGLCEIGAVSPDYPYLDSGIPRAAVWADEMHYRRTGAMVNRGIERVRHLTGEARRKCLAWLLGYVSHVVADMTIHPMVERKVGPYHGNEDAHHECERHQDAYICRRLKPGSGRTLHRGPGELLDPDIEALWRGMLRDVYGPAGTRPEPDPLRWHHRFWMGRVGKDSGRVVPADEFIVDLAVPGGRLHYDMIFDKAVVHAGEAWRIVADGVLRSSQDYRTRFGNWNLDTGRDQDTGAYVYWG